MDALPTEIIIKILSYLPILDLIQFTRAFESYSCFLKERHVVKCISFRKMFDMSNFDICSFITTNLGFKYIRVLNIESLYWIPLNNLRQLLGKLDNLEELYALDTSLGLRVEDMSYYGRLTKLSITAEGNHFNDTITTDHYFNVFYKLKKLLIKFVSKKESMEDIYVFFFALTQLTELWLFDVDENYSINYDRIVSSLFRLTKLVIKSKRLIPLLDFSCFGLMKVFQNKRYEFSVEYIFERMSLVGKQTLELPSNPTKPLEKAWETFKLLHSDLPCGPRDFEFCGESINDIYFEDFNFCHALVLCNPKCIKAALQILLSKNVTRLKRLALRTCLFQPLKVVRSSSVTIDDISCFSKSTGPFGEIADNFKDNLKVLEISQCPDHDFDEGFYCLNKFESLEKLTLELGENVKGDITKETFLKCKKLKAISFTFTQPNEKFVNELYLNLKYAQTLRDFRLEHHEIDAEKLFKSLNEISNKTLLRIFIKCDNLFYASEPNDIDNFLNNNPQLILLFLVVANVTMKQTNDIQKILKKFKNPARIFYVRKTLPQLNGVFPIPSAHHDFINNFTCVSVIDSDDF